MRIVPVLIDSQPRYMHGARGAASLLLAPSGATSVLCALHSRLPGAEREPITIATTFAPSAAYEEAIHGCCRQVAGVVGLDALDDLLASCAPGDWVLLADPRCFPLARVEEDALLARLAYSHAVVHLVSMNRNPGGATDRVQHDRRGAIRGVQRYYDARTWTLVAGVVCSFVPATTLADLLPDLIAGESLDEFRLALASRGVLARDLSVHAETVDLTQEPSLLRVTERAVLEPAVDPRSRQTTRIHPTARLLGPLVVHDDVAIDAGAQVIGPAVLGPGSSVGAGAVVAQCVLGAHAVVPADAVVRHRVVFGIGPTGDRYGDGEAPVAIGVLAESSPEPARSLYPIVKLAFDSATAALLLLLLLPLLAIVAVLIKLESHGPVFYGEIRETLGGRLFKCWKFRTMRPGAEAEQRTLAARNQMDGPQFKINGDPRITRIGRWLRKVSIDELPQLYNVLIGDMSLVGPRPSPFRENQVCVPWRQARLSVRAGITGLWQVCRDERTRGDFHQWIEYDTMYVRHLSWGVDLRILMATVFTLGGARRVPPTWIIRERRASVPARTARREPVSARASV